MKITICGAGNAAQTLIALLAAEPGATVAVYAPLTDEAARLRQAMQVDGVCATFPNGRQLCGRAAVVTADAAEAGTDASLVLLALPAFAHEAVLRALAPHLPEDVWIGALPARGGFDLLAQQVLGRLQADGACVLFGLQTLPWACRIRDWGSAVDVLGAKAAVDVAVWPATIAGAVAATLSSLIHAPLAPVTNFLALTLANTGQIIHPGIMYGLFHRWDGTPFPAAQIPLFYGGVDGATAALLATMSEEVLAVRDAIARAAPGLDLASVVDVQTWLLDAYPEQIADKHTLQAAFNSNTAYAGLRAPVEQVGDNAFVPAFTSRYLAEDVPYSLLVTRGIAELAGVATPTIDRVICWAQARLGREYLVDGRVAGRDIAASHAPQRFGIDSLAALIGDYEL
ncbi:MAG: NAD/NADP octopine/nopaline dehydrogenase family protein [Caldilineaceae bacterium]|nr:NAD/NADP octopine/nopaline dehydrogenase family protein [Caldilineaceae bacterium]